MAATNGTGGSPTINTYDEYGIPGISNTGRFQYTGQAWLAELGMYYYKARIYSPTLGRFLQTDPIGYDDQFNLYAYVGNDPVNRSDPSGKSWQDVGNIVLGTGEAIIGTVGGATPVAVPAALASSALVVGSAAVSADGLRRIGNGISGLLHGKPTISEARRGGPGPYRCSNPTCDAPHGGTTGTTECPDCDGKRKGGAHYRGPSRGIFRPRQSRNQGRSQSQEILKLMVIEMNMKRGSELRLMLDGSKPMAVFYRSTSEIFDEKDGQPFDKFVKSGKINRSIFYINNKLQDFTIFYTVYTLPGEEWRADMYKALKKTGQNIWNEELQCIEDFLFGFRK